MPGLNGLELASVLGRFAAAPAGGVRDRAHASTRSRPSTSRAVDYVLKPVREERLREAVRRISDAGATATRRRGDPAGRARRGHPVREPLRRRLRGGAGRLRPAAHRHREPPRPAAAEPARSSAGPTPASCASTARCWSRSPTSTRSAPTTVAARCWCGGTELQVSRRHTPELRELLRQDRQGDHERPGRTPHGRSSAAGSRVTGPRTRTAAPDLRRLRDRRADRARRDLHALADAHPAAARPRGGAGARGHRRRAAGAVRGRARRCARALLGVPLPWLLLGVVRLPGARRSWRVYVRRAERNEAAFNDMVGPGERTVITGLRAVTAVLAVLAVSLATLAVGAVGLRLSRTTSDFYVASRAVGPALNASAISGEYLSAASFLGVAGLVLAARRRPALVPGRLDRRLPAAAGLRRRAAAPLPGLHAARLRRVPRRVAGRAAGLERAGGAHRRALPGAAVPGRRPDPPVR